MITNDCIAGDNRNDCVGDDNGNDGAGYDIGSGGDNDGVDNIYGNSVMILTVLVVLDLVMLIMMMVCDGKVVWLCNDCVGYADDNMC
jgi:hypothetical protein